MSKFFVREANLVTKLITADPSRRGEGGISVRTSSSDIGRIKGRFCLVFIWLIFWRLFFFIFHKTSKYRVAPPCVHSYEKSWIRNGYKSLKLNYLSFLLLFWTNDEKTTPSVFSFSIWIKNIFSERNTFLPVHLSHVSCSSSPSLPLRDINMVMLNDSWPDRSTFDPPWVVGNHECFQTVAGHVNRITKDTKKRPFFYPSNFSPCIIIYIT